MTDSELDVVVGEPESLSTPASTVPVQKKIRVGFTAAVLDDGEFVFNIHGTQPGLVELHGLVDFAKKVVDAQMAEQLHIGESAIIKRLDGLMQEVKTIQEEVAALRAS
jgi:hypothetical protein